MLTPRSDENDSVMLASTGSKATASDSEFSSAGSEFTYEERVQRYQLRKRERLRKRSLSGCLGGPAAARPAGHYGTCTLPDMLEGLGLLINNLEYVGGGAFARVYRGSWYRRAEEAPIEALTVAVKCVRSRHLCHPLRRPRWLEREAQMARVQRHANLVQVFEVAIHSEPCVLVMEYCVGGSVHDLLHGSGGGARPPAAPGPDLGAMDWGQRMKVALDVAAGMERLHSLGILHRDLKTANVMLAERPRPGAEPQAKIGDFGLARLREEEGPGGKGRYLSLDVGSSIYMAPEVFACMADEHPAPYGDRMDVYSYAMLVYELLTDRFPYEGREEVRGRNPQTVGHLVGREHVRPDVGQIPWNAPAAPQSIMRKCWAPGAAERPSFQQVLHELEPAYIAHLYLTNFESWQT